MNAARLLWADYRAQYGYTGEGRRRAVALALPRLLVDPSLHALLLVRATAAAPPPARGALRRLLLATHAIWLDDDAQIGPGLVLRHPIGIALGRGARLGAGVALLQNVTVTDAAVGDRAALYAGAAVLGPLTVGEDAMVGGGVTLRSDVAAGGRVVRDHGGEDGRPAVLGAAEPVDAAVLGVPTACAPGLLATLRADHAARFGGRRASTARVLADALRDRSLRVVATIRLLQRGPRPLWRMWRRVLIAHGCDIGHDARIGPALGLPAPVGVVVGRRAVLGTGVTLHEHTCVTPTRTRWQPTDAAGGVRIGDGVQFRAGAAAFGELSVAPGAIIAPRAVLLRDVGPGDTPPPRVVPPHHGPDRMAALVRTDARRAPVTSAAFQAALLVRAATAGPRALRRPARAALRALHHIYVDGDATIGPGLALPRPVGVHLGAGILVGANVTIEDRVTIEAGAPAVPDGATLATATVLTAVHQTASRLSRPLNVAGPAAAETPRRKQVPLS